MARIRRNGLLERPRILRGERKTSGTTRHQEVVNHPDAYSPHHMKVRESGRDANRFPTENKNAIVWAIATKIERP